MINWKIRFKNKIWVASLLSQTAILVQAIIAGLFTLGVIPVDLTLVDLWVKVLLGIGNTVLVYLSFLGIVQDPTVEGIGDSQRSLRRKEPLKEELDER
ncbi:MAG: phage holin [Bacillota bacterium]